jgi:membrane associated rhomboid family serine protease
MNQFTGVVKHLVIINVIVFFGASMLSSSMPAIMEILPLYFPKSAHFIPSQIVSHMFMHGSISHLLFNMLTLFFLGPYVEKYLGPRKFLFFYLFAGFGAMISHIAIDYFQYLSLVDSMDPAIVRAMMEQGRQVLLPSNVVNSSDVIQMYSILNTPVVGASGAIYGVLIAFAMFFPNTRLMLLIPPIPVKAKYLALALIAFDLFAGVSGQKTGIAHFAHLGGALFGFLLILYWRSKYGRR